MGKVESPVITRLKREEHAAALSNLAKQKNKATTNKKNCILLKMAPSKPGGYIQLFVNSNTKVLAHVLARFDDWNKLQEHIKDPSFFQGKDVSHLCGNCLCVNPDHLILEDSKTNQRRKGCKGYVTCPCPCNHTFNVCSCDPVNKCI